MPLSTLKEHIIVTASCPHPKSIKDQTSSPAIKSSLSYLDLNPSLKISALESDFMFSLIDTTHSEPVRKGLVGPHQK